MNGSGHAELHAANRKLLRKLLIVALGMFGFGFALVPFYETICEVTGIRNVFKPDTVSAENTQVDTSRTVSVEFDSNTQTLAWTFKPLEGSLAVHPGAVTQVIYEVRNTLDRPVTGQAVPSYAPQYAAGYFKKLECFCFKQQTLAPGEVRRMPVVFVIDPSVPADVRAITLSYTFFEVAGTRGKRG
ncbi:MAG: cytochrome c oxidase assembly protein [Betaproteobacteria bacterium RIFCSPLOWO2_02_FULL_65_24]|nr:MAG: cytochrome c oxidase assembly protein [Betaproteobacteria bacterium RIFCSPLOWO2_02_FULL_65_24]OGA96703.1 MAG: cytochrome c oxidase assembly protein [Betaproteobacteria bacterium RIFCSPLOWO2_12_FULL_66_14]